MQSKRLAIGFATLAIFGSVWAVSRGKAKPTDHGIQEALRKDLTLTLYADDFAMVREMRPSHLEAGNNRLYLREVSNQLDPQSVLLRWAQAGNQAPEIASNAYDIGVTGGNALLKRYLGKEVELVRYGESGHQGETTSGTLMSAETGNLVLQSEGKFLVNPQGTIVAPVQDDIVPIPQVSVQTESATAQDASLDFSYLTRGLSWSTDYSATLALGADTMRLECWATVINRTGTNYPNAKVTLVAGSPNRAAVPAKGRSAMFKSKRVSLYDAEDLKEREASFAAPEIMGEMYAYPIKTPTTVIQEQMNRLRMFSGEQVSVLRDYNTRNPSLYAYEGYYGDAAVTRGNVAVGLTFFNKEKEGLGMPLPAGTIRLYEPDASGVARYIGAGAVQNTPKDQKVYLSLATSFDTFTEFRLVKSQQMNKNTLRKTVEVTLHNQKPGAVALRVLQAFGGQWKIVEETHKSVRANASEAQWKIALPATSKTILRFVVEMKV